MDEPISFADLCAVDDLTLHFWPGGLAGALMQPKDSLRYLQESIAGAQLVDVVPEEVRDNFERVRKTFLYGLLEYDLFTVADDDARLILEGALRNRFVSYYEGQITILRAEEKKVLSVPSFDDLYKRLRREDLLVPDDESRTDEPRNFVAAHSLIPDHRVLDHERRRGPKLTA